MPPQVMGGHVPWRISSPNRSFVRRPSGQVDFPCVETTAGAFGGPNLDPVRNDWFAQDSDEPDAGMVFVVDGLGVSGVPSLLTESDPFPLCLEPVATNMKSSDLLLLLGVPGRLPAGEFSSDFQNTHDRVWLGEEYWANPMEDWLVRDGRIVCARNGANRNVHLLAYGLNSDDPSASFVLSVRMGVEEKTKRGSAGFLVGVIDQETRDPRASLLMGKGMAVGVRTNGKLFIGKEESKELCLHLRICMSWRLSHRRKRVSRSSPVGS